MWTGVLVVAGHGGAGQARPAVSQAGLEGGPPATILLLRHAEKTAASGVDLSPEGFARARELPKLFAGPGARFPAPQVIFATHASAKSNRPVETVTPLAEALHLPIESEIGNGEYAALARLLLSGRYAGEVVLVAWHHGTMPQLARALGAVPPVEAIPETQFDRMWRIDYGGGRARLRDLPEGLMAGDSK